MHDCDRMYIADFMELNKKIVVDKKHKDHTLDLLIQSMNIQQ